jgi:hypothetical protein
MEIQDRQHAPESEKIARAREKLLKQWEAEKKGLTPQALQKAVDQMHKWIADNAQHRTSVKPKSIGLFDKNKNVAAISKKVREIAERLKA